MLLAEGWAEPVGVDEPAISEVAADTSSLPNLIREIYPPYYDAPNALAADRRSRRRRRRPRGT